MAGTQLLVGTIKVDRCQSLPHADWYQQIGERLQNINDSGVGPE
jgi:hypothetical protein